MCYDVLRISNLKHIRDTKVIPERKFKICNFFFCKKKPFVKKFFFKYFLLNFIKTLKEWKKTHNSTRNFNFFLLNLIRKHLLLKIKIFKQKMAGMSVFVLDFFFLLKCFNKIISNLLSALIFFQRKFVQTKTLFDEILIRKFYLFHVYQIYKKTNILLLFCRSTINDTSTNHIKVGNFFYTIFLKKFQSKKNYILHCKNYKKKVKPYKSLSSKLKFLKIKCLNWFIFLSRKFFIKKRIQHANFCAESYGLFLLFKKNKSHNLFRIKKNKETNTLMQWFFLILHKIDFFKTNAEKILKFILNFKIKKTNKHFGNLDSFLHSNVVKCIHYIIFYNLIRIQFNFKKFVNFLFIIYRYKFNYFLNIKTNLLLKILYASETDLFFTKNIIFKLRIKYGFICVYKFIFIHRLLDMDKELHIIWLIVKFFKIQKNNTHLVALKRLFEQKFSRLKNNFIKIVFNVKQKLIIVQKSNSALKKIILKKIKNQCKIENKLYEIKNMELDFFEILNQFTYIKKYVK